MKKFILTFTVCISFIVIQSSASVIGEWNDPSNQAQFILSSNGSYTYQGKDGSMQGQFVTNQNLLTLQDSFGNYYQYQFAMPDDNKLQVMDGFGNMYYYQRSQPVSKDTYISDSSSFSESNQHSQPYVELLEFLIGKKLSATESQRVRQQVKQQLQANSQALIADKQQVQSSLNQIQNFATAEQVAMIREQLLGQFYISSASGNELQNNEIMKVLFENIQVLAVDSSSGLNLTNQDVNGYVQYLQFMAQINGQSMSLNSQELATLQFQVVQLFQQGNLQQKQNLAYAAYLWDTLASQWNAMSVSQHQQWLQSQYASNPNTQYDHSQNYDYSYNVQSYDINSLEQKYRQEAAAKGMSLNQYLDYKQRDMAANNQMFNMIQNSMTESHATMLNVINNMGGSDDYYYVDYGQ